MAYDPKYHKDYRERPGIKERRAVQNAAWKAAHPDQVERLRREWQYRTKYGISIADYDLMLVAQGGRCAVCRTNRPGKGRNRFFCVDHRHVPGFEQMPPEEKRLRVRGLLCVTCNLVVGKIEECPGHYEAYLPVRALLAGAPVPKPDETPHLG